MIIWREKFLGEGMRIKTEEEGGQHLHGTERRLVCQKGSKQGESGPGETRGLDTVKPKEVPCRGMT